MKARVTRAHDVRAGSAPFRGRAKKVSLTVDESVLSAMQREAKKSKRTLSAEVTEALARELRRRRLSELIASYEEEKGAITAKELAAIQAEWLE
jgi:post-segregation antitoxin (ccd killing protein)